MRGRDRPNLSLRADARREISSVDRGRRPFAIYRHLFIYHFSTGAKSVMADARVATARTYRCRGTSDASPASWEAGIRRDASNGVPMTLASAINARSACDRRRADRTKPGVMGSPLPRDAIAGGRHPPGGLTPREGQK